MLKAQIKTLRQNQSGGHKFLEMQKNDLYFALQKNY